MAPELKEFTLEQIAKHNSDNDCWLIVSDKVYDVTKYLDDHPGGAEIITDLAGMDGTEDFFDVGHSEEAFDMLDDYLIGVVTGTAAAKAFRESGGKRDAVEVKGRANSASSFSGALSQKEEEKEVESDSSMLWYGIGAIAAAGVAFLVFRKQKVAA